MSKYILAIDQGTTSSRAFILNEACQVMGSAQQEFSQIYPSSGWVEHDPDEIYSSVIDTCKGAMANANISPADIAGIGITNQRETTVVWDRETGAPVYHAIVWQDRRTAEITDALKKDGCEELVRRSTGLLLDPYFSATKIAWILDHVDGAHARAEQGKLAFGTIDTFLIWRLTGGKHHVTDATNASRTMLYDIHTGTWSDELLKLFNVPRAVLPEVFDCAAAFGGTDTSVFGCSIPILAVAGDQQAATIGQACFKPGMLKATYGTGCFAMLNTGATPVTSQNRLLTTIAYQLDGDVTYALEGSIFIAGAAVQWLRDGLKIIKDASETGDMAAVAKDNGVYLVPAFVGLGAPYWDPDCRGAMFGLTRDSGPDEFALAALESVCFQTYDLIQAMQGDWQSGRDTVLRVDGGMVESEWLLQRLSDIMNAPIDRPRMLQTTVMGAGYLAGMQAGIYGAPDAFASKWALDQRYTPEKDDAWRTEKIAGWHDAVKRTLTNQ